MTDSCQTCSSELSFLALRSAYIPACCSSPICAGCISRNPRLREYSPCLKCGDPRAHELKGRSGFSARALARPSGGGAGQAAALASGTEVMFEIGDDEDEEGEELPVYADVVREADGGAADGGSTGPAEQGAASPPRLGALGADDEVVEEEAMETVEVRHTVSRSDNLLAIARRYAADPHDLLTLNNLPPTTLSTHPRLLHTRKSILISRRQVPRSHLSSLAPPSIADGAKGRPTREEDEERERQKQIKRFQLLTKSVDPAIGKTYLSLEAMKEDPDHPLHPDNLRELPAGGGEGQTGKKVHMAERENREERALEAFWDDEDWERAQGSRGPQKQRVGRWKVVGAAASSPGGAGVVGSRLGIKG
ncbi:hypothetical protein IAU60_005390 [Kwoniella sp. DSM 27419]